MATETVCVQVELDKRGTIYLDTVRDEIVISPYGIGIKSRFEQFNPHKNERESTPRTTWFPWHMVLSYQTIEQEIK